MKIGFDPYLGTRGRIPAPQLVDTLADVGFDGMNVILTPDFMPADNTALIAATIERLHARGLRVPTLYWSQDHLLRERGALPRVREWMKRVVDVAVQFDAPTIGVGLWGHVKGLTIEEERANLTESLQAILPVATRAGRRLSMEFETEGVLTLYTDAIAFVRAVDDRLRLTADTYHMFNHKADFHAAALALRGLLGEVHISGSDRGEPGSTRDVCDHAALMRGLRETGYDGWLVSQFKLDDPASIARSGAFLTRLAGR